MACHLRLDTDAFDADYLARRVAEAAVVELVEHLKGLSLEEIHQPRY